MLRASRGTKLARRYPLLESVPEDERPAVMRAALRHPLLLLPVLLAALLVLPPYFEFALRYLGVGARPENLFELGKIGCAVLLPVVIAVPLLQRLVIPPLLLRVMKKRGYEPKDRTL